MLELFTDIVIISDSGKDPEVISLKNDKISVINGKIPSIPKELERPQGIRLPNGDLLLSGGQKCKNGSAIHGCSEKYLIHKKWSNEWIEVGKMMLPRQNHASILMNGVLYSCGGWDSSEYEETISHHEAFNLSEHEVKEMKNMPIALDGHTATKIDDNKYLIAGGRGNDVSVISIKVFDT